MKKMLFVMFLLFYTAFCYSLDDDQAHKDLEASIKKVNDDLSALALITPKQHKIGELYHGGIIFWLDESMLHGLIASARDINQGAGIQWRNGVSGTRITNAKADGIGAGESNTRLIVAEQTTDQQKGNFAALMASRYSVMEDGVTPCPKPINITELCFGGWYLPSIYELELLRATLANHALMTFAPDYYWSSTESSATNAFMENFPDGQIIEADKANTLGKVRAIAHF